MFNREDFAIHVDPNDIKEIGPLIRERFQWINVKILYKDSFSLCPNFNIERLINNDYMLNQETLMKLQESEIKYKFTFNEIMELKQNNIDFYLLDDKKFQNIMSIIGFNNFDKLASGIFLMEEKENIILFFSGDFRYILIQKNIDESITRQAIKAYLQMKNSNNPEYQERIPSEIEQYSNKKNVIIQLLILFYANDKEIMKFFKQGIYDLKNYYLVNKDWVDKFKEIYYFNEVSKISIIKGINNLEDYIRGLKTFESLNEIKLIYNKIKIDHSTLPKMYLTLIEKKAGEYGQYIFPTNFTIISKSILDLLKYFTNCSINTQYEINFGKSSLCLRSYNDLNKIYIYNYTNNLFCLFGVIDLFADVWINIFNRYLSKISFSTFLVEKKINEYIKNQKQNLISTGDRHLGYIYLIEEKERINRFQESKKNERNSKSLGVNNNNKIKKFNNPVVNYKPNNIRIVRLMNDNQQDIEFNKKLKIIKILALFYGNEKEVNTLYSHGIYNLKNFHIVNKVWIDKFKEIFNYKEIYNLPLLKDIKSLDDCKSKLQNLGTSNQIKPICNKINLNSFSLFQINFTPEIKTLGEYNFIDNFLLIHDSILSLLKDFTNIEYNINYEISFGKSSACLRLNYILNKIYIYNYNNDAFNISCIIHLFDDYWKNIYEQFFSKMDIYQYLVVKQINGNIINQKQNLFSKSNQHIGYIILIEQVSQNIAQPINENEILIQDNNDINTVNNNSSININFNDEPINDIPLIKSPKIVNQPNNEEKIKIIKCLISLYVNEKEIKKKFF